MKRFFALFLACLVLLSSCMPRVIPFTTRMNPAEAQSTAALVPMPMPAVTGAATATPTAKAQLVGVEKHSPAGLATATPGVSSPSGAANSASASAKTSSSAGKPGCATSAPSSASYTVTVCFSEPGDGAELSGEVNVTATVSVTGANSRVQRMIFYLNSQYLLTDFQSPYTFTLPTSQWVDGTYSLQVEALLRDGFVSDRAAQELVFNNGVTAPPVNNAAFKPSAGTPPSSGAPFVVAAAGDGASGETNAAKVVDLIASIHPNLFLSLGDVYEKGSPLEFYNWYGLDGSNFGRFRSITNPTIGNHEYTTGSSAGYFQYWDNIPNYYSFDAGGWHFISLNSNSSKIDVSASSSQYAWLQQDLALHANECTIVYYHQPLFNIGPEGPASKMTDIWTLLAQSHVTMVLNGHDHDYQRWVPMDGSGNPNPQGVTEFVAGGGGHGLQTIATTDSRVAYSNSNNPTALGALKLELNPKGASFSYLSITGSTLDSGVIPCASSGSDTQSPNSPRGLTATAAPGAGQVNLSWQASVDNIGIAGYTIYRDGVVLTNLSGTELSYSDFKVQALTSYTYTIEAFDQAGNHSEPSEPVSVTTGDAPDSITFAVDADTYVNAASPKANYGSASFLRLDSAPDLHAYLRFKVQGLAGKSVVRARLLVYANTNSPDGMIARAVTDNTWDESTLSYANAPVLGGAIASSGTIVSQNWATFDVTAYINGEGVYSFGLSTPSKSALSLAARESGSNAAQLIIDLK